MGRGWIEVLPWSLRPGAAHGTRKARSMADVRAARTEEKFGHSGRDDRERKKKNPGAQAGVPVPEKAPASEGGRYKCALAGWKPALPGGFAEEFGGG